MASTIIDVAKRAGVSIATVSGVLNGSRYVSPELRERVLAAVRELDYTVNQVARSLQARSTRMIGMLVPDISDPFHANVVRIVETALKTAGYTLLLGNLRDRPEEQARYLHILRAQQVDGILIYMVPGCEDELRKLVESWKPVVLMGRAPTTFQADLVATDHVTGTRLAIEHLMSRGHRRIGIIPGPEPQPFSRSRIHGWRQALAGSGLPADDHYISYGDYTIEGGALAASHLLDLREPPTAILAGNFHEVVGVLRVLRQRRIKRPDQVEVMSSHDSEVLDAFDPPVSSVDQPVRELGTNATELLLRRIRQPGRPPEQILLQPRLKIRSFPASPLSIGAAAEA
ncbi:MAG: LacI family DNA-binding transcriptional regulator [Acidobacteria bacterium]|nr:LacI family DNA-binding transcriptional regulator [Acidobacteriota bacterium]